MRNRRKQIAGVLVLTLLIAGTATAQVTWGKQTLKRGKLWSTIWNSLQYGDPTETENGFHTIDSDRLARLRQKKIEVAKIISEYRQCR